MRAAACLSSCCLARVRASAPSSTEVVITEPAPTMLRAPTVTGATSDVFDPMKASSPIWRVFGPPVVVAGDGPCADIGSRPDVRHRGRTGVRPWRRRRGGVLVSTKFRPCSPSSTVPPQGAIGPTVWDQCVRARRPFGPIALPASQRCWSGRPLAGLTPHGPDCCRAGPQGR